MNELLPSSVHHREQRPPIDALPSMTNMISRFLLLTAAACWVAATDASGSVAAVQVVSASSARLTRREQAERKSARTGLALALVIMAPSTRLERVENGSVR